MKKNLLILIAASVLVSGLAFADKVRDWKDLDRVHNRINQAIGDMERARKANHYDMDGHGEKAEQYLRQAEHELHDAVESAKRAK